MTAVYFIIKEKFTIQRVYLINVFIYFTERPGDVKFDRTEQNSFKKKKAYFYGYKFAKIGKNENV